MHRRQFVKTAGLSLASIALSQAPILDRGGLFQQKQYQQSGATNLNWFVDSINGNDNNDGLTPNTAFATIGKLMSQPVVEGQRIGLAANSMWREQLTLPMNNLIVYAYGYGAMPLLDCSDEIPNESFNQTGGTAYVFQVGITTNYIASEPGFVSVWENGVRLKFQNSLAACDATPGTYYVANHNSVNITVYVHSSDSSDIRSNGKLYEISTRRSGIYAYGITGTIIDGIHCRRNFSLGGSIKVGPRSILLGCTCSEGNSHNLYVRTGSCVYDCSLESAYYILPSTMLVVNEDRPNMEGAIIEKCRFINTDNPLASPHNSHFNVSGSFGTITVKDCSYDGFTTNGSMFGFNHCDLVSVINPIFVNCNLGITAPFGPSPNGVMHVSGGEWSQMAGLGRAVSISSSATPIVIDGMQLYCDGVTDTGLVAVLAGADVTVRNCNFYNRQASGQRTGIFCNKATARITLQNNCYDGDYGWSRHYFFANAALGMIWESDYNHFAPNFAEYIFGVAYSDMAAYQAATLQDSHSDLVPCA